jgi:sulfur-oxidizing protein SoxY
MQRREFVKTSVIAAGVLMMGCESMLFAADKDATVDEIVAKVTGGKGAKAEHISLIAPAIAENGQMVPLKVEVVSPMSDADHVKAIHIYAVGNPTPKVISTTMSPANGKAYFSTRTKLAKSQDVVAIAELSNGTFVKDVKNIKVTVGGCG